MCIDEYGLPDSENNQGVDDTRDSLETGSQARENSQNTEKNNGAKGTLMDRIVGSLSEEIGVLVRANDRKDFGKQFTDVLKTINAINCLPELGQFLFLGTGNYSYSSYEVLDFLETFVGPASVKIDEDDDSTDVLDRSFFEMTKGQILSPDRFALAQAKICHYLRRKKNVVKIDRKPALLASVIKEGMVVYERCESSTQEKLIPLKTEVLFGRDRFRKNIRTDWVPKYVAENIYPGSSSSD